MGSPESAQLWRPSGPTPEIWCVCPGPVGVSRGREEDVTGLPGPGGKAGQRKAAVGVGSGPSLEGNPQAGSTWSEVGASETPGEAAVNEQPRGELGGGI